MYLLTVGIADLYNRISALRKTARLSLRSQDQIGQRYELREKIGAGEFAQVFKAWDQEKKRMVAVKIVKDHPRFIQAALQEASIL